MSIRNILIAAVVLTTAFLGGAGMIYFDWQDAPDFTEPDTAQEQAGAADDPVTPLPLTISLDSRKVELGRRLFHEPKLSGDGTLSCASCHSLATGGVDRLPSSRGVGDREGGINSPTVFNSGFNFRQFWDGRARTLEEQIDIPLLSKIEMDSTWPQVMAALSADPQYRSGFAAIYDDGIQPHNVRDAIGAFERSLITPNSRFDRFLRGDKTALNDEELAGYRLFKQVGCISCHQGMNIGGNMFQKLGVMEDYFAVRGNPTEADMGRFNVTKQERDRHFFKVPSLRNVAVTPPYLHDGSARTLEDALEVMVRFQLGTTLDADEVGKIVAFLHTLTGEYLGKPLE